MRLFQSRIRSLGRGYKRRLSTNSRFFTVSDEVQQAIAERRPVVALETTIYTHGFPYPQNLSLATDLESIIRKGGAVPATIGILDGVARVGLSHDELTLLVSSAGSPRTLKLSRRDLGFALGMKDSKGQPFNGGTTIAATMILAHLAGIKVFATGGLGGVHRGGETTMDISADLTELGRTPVAVISSGCKAFLDLPKTLEYLETQGVAVATFADGRTGPIDFPAFWSRQSGVPSPMILKDEIEAARVIHAHMSLGLQSGLHFANPIPEHHSLPLEVVEAGIYEALNHANLAGIVGSAATPYILAKMKEITGDESVESNRALIEANVTRGTRVATELCKIETDKADESIHQSAHLSSYNYLGQRVSNDRTPTNIEPRAPTITREVETSFQHERKPNVFVAGSLAVDLSCDFIDRAGRVGANGGSQPTLRTSNPSRIIQSLGGVGSNVARAASLMGAEVHLCSAVGDDLSGKAALEALNAARISTSGIKIFPSDSDKRTAQYVAVNDTNKDLVLAMADMSILESTNPEDNGIKDTFQNFWLPQLQQAQPSHVVIDANWSDSDISRWFECSKSVNAHVTFEPVSKVKAANLFRSKKPFNLSVYPRQSLDLSTPNSYELAAMYSTARENGVFDRSDWWEVVDALGIPQSGARVQLSLATSAELVDQGIPQQSIQLLPFIPSICTKLGSRGVLLTQLIPAHDERLTRGDYSPYIVSRCANNTEDNLGVGGVYMRLFPAVEELKSADIVSVNGVGDTFAGTLVAGLANSARAKIEDLIDLAQRAAVLSLRSRESVSPGLGTLRILM